MKRGKCISVLSALLLVFAAGCEDEIAPGQFGSPSIVSSSASVSESGAVISCTLSGRQAVTECGVYLGVDESHFTRYSDSYLGTGSFSVVVGDLASDTDYFFKAFVSNGRTELLSELASFHTEASLSPDSDGGDGDDPGQGDDGSQTDTTVTPDPVSSVAVDDEVLQAWLLRHYDSDDDGVLSADEAGKVKKINIETAEVKTLAGIGNFPNLNYLRVCAEDISGGGSLTEADLSGNPLLKTVDLSYNQISSIKFGDNSVLATLRLQYNSLTDIDLSELPSLATLDCSHNSLSSLSVESNVALTNLNCAANEIASLDVTALSALQELDCSDNQLTSMDFSGSASLVSLVCYGNMIVSLDLTQCEALTTLSASPMDSLVEVHLISGHGYTSVRVPSATLVYYD